jgi:hypothetical protein
MISSNFLFVGVMFVISAAIFVAWRVNTLFFGLSWLAFFAVSSATLSAFAHATSTRASMEWYTSYHAEVVQYSIFGCLAMLCGMALGWRAWLPKCKHTLTNPLWINKRFGVFLFVIAVVAAGAQIFLRQVPTLSTGLELLVRFRELGLLVLIVDAINRKNWNVLLVVSALYVPIVLAAALATGHTPAKVDLLIPAACIIVGWGGVRLRSLAIISVLGLCYYIFFVSWMQSRDLIRSGSLEKLGFSEAALTLSEELVTHVLNVTLDADVVNDYIRLRVDMTDILAQQVAFQPNVQPYVYGATLFESGIALIPRALWPGKPVIAGGSLFVERFTGSRRSSDDTTSIGLPYPFELYANGGRSWVVVGLGLIGFGIARLELMCKERRFSLSKRLLMLSVLLTLSAGGQRMDVVLPSLVAGALAAWAVGYAIEKFQPNFATSLEVISNVKSRRLNNRRARSDNPKNREYSLRNR